jgi:Asp-tRNA(Asn)/Glu-tRNA(Gln) amidotransferase A subunit family amidase
MTSTYDPAQAYRRDLCATRNAIRFDQSSASFEMESAISIAESPASRHVYLRTMFDEARRLAADTSKTHLPLAGLAVSVKDLFDIEGQTSAAGSTVLADDAPAPQDCPAVARLRASGGVVIGRTNMVEFAFSGVGINPHFGTPANPRSPGLARVPGGSSSGAAVSVATGSAFVGLGSDTGGSIRIPAALNGIVGFKPTARLVPTEGAVPLSTTMDTVCAMTRSVRDAMVVHEILSAQAVKRSPAPLSSYRLAVVKPLMQDGLDYTVARVWQRTLDSLRSAGAWIREIDLREIDELPAMAATGGFSAAESYAWHFNRLQTHAAQYDPRVLTRIQRGASMSAREYFDLHTQRKSWITRVEAALQAYDAVLSPTVPIVAPPMAEVAPGPERDAAFFSANAQLLRNTSVVNMLDGCAISIPCHEPEDLPVGLMIWAPALKDDKVLNIAHQAEASLAQSMS